MVQKMRPILFRQARKLLPSEEAEDIVQDVLCKLWQIREQLNEYKNVNALALIMTRNLCLNHIRDNRMDVSINDINEVIYADDESFNDKENIQRIYDLMMKLPDLQQAVLRMKHIDGLEVSDIARITGTREDAVRANLSRARKKIKEQFMLRRSES